MKSTFSLVRAVQVVSYLLLVLLLSDSTQVAALKRVQSLPNGQLTDCNAGPYSQCVFFEPLYTLKHMSPSQASLPPNQPRIVAWYDGRDFAACNEEQGFCQFSVPQGRKVKFSFRCVQPRPKHELGRVFGLMGNLNNLKADTWGRFVVRGSRTKAQWGDKHIISSSREWHTYSKRHSQQLTIYCN